LFAASSNNARARARGAALRAFVKLGRPIFLGGGFVMYGLGAAVAAAGGARIDWGRYGWGQLLVTATQLATHYSNDYFDVEADRANRTPTRWSGGSRVLSGGALPAWVALAAALMLTALALAAALVLSFRAADAPLLLPLALVTIALAWAYSAPPPRLCARGLGELATATVVTLLVPVLGFHPQAAATQAGALAAPVLAAAVLPCTLQFAMLLAIEFPDAAGDAATGKRTLVVRLGAPMAARLYALVTLAGYAALPLLVRAGLPSPAAVLPTLLAPVALWQAVRVVRGGYRDPARWESVAFWSVALLVGSAGAELIGIVVAIRLGG
jgi:1,4-dihydroxy-2-naphthoate octaprenyltransferase